MKPLLLEPALEFVAKGLRCPELYLELFHVFSFMFLFPWLSVLMDTAIFVFKNGVTAPQPR